MNLPLSPAGRARGRHDLLPSQAAAHTTFTKAIKSHLAMREDVTQLLIDWSRGNPQALDQLMPLVYDELHRLAERYMRRERSDHTLQPTALVHEAYLKLVDQNRVEWRNRAHFFGVAAQLMRRITMVHVRDLRAAKRGGGKWLRVTLDSDQWIDRQADDLVALDDALKDLAKFDPRLARIVELRFFGGLKVDETAAVLGISPATVKREWQTAKAWLHSELQPDKQSGKADAS